jgi:hypothetical protein
MTRWRKFLFTVAGAILAVLTAYKFFYPTVIWHQKLTINVDFKGQIVSGSSVVAVTATKIPNILFVGMRWSFRGEAAVVQMPEGKYLFALLGGGDRPGAIDIAGRVFPEALASEPSDGIRQARAIKNQKGVREVSYSDAPLLVTFTDINDPKTAKEVDPADLVAAFGSGVSLESITLEITDEKVTEGEVKKALKWLGEHPETPLLPKLDPKDFSLVALLRQGVFIKK